MLICGITATAETIIVFCGIGKILMIPLIVSILFFLFLILWAIQETVKTPDRYKNSPDLSFVSQQEKKSDQSLITESNNRMPSEEMAPKKQEGILPDRMEKYPATAGRQDIPGTRTLQPHQSFYVNCVPQTYRETQPHREQADSRCVFSIENLCRIYDFSWMVTNEDRKNMLRGFLDKKVKLELTNQAKNEVYNLQRNTALLAVTDDAGAEFFLYDNAYLVPALETYLSWYRKPYDQIREELQDRMINYIFSYDPQNVTGNMSMTKLKPARVTEIGNGEYLVEEANKGILFFGNGD